MKGTKEQGITLLALIITIIVLVILAAVTINAAFSNRIIDTAVNGALNYADAQNKEKVTFDELDGSIQNIVNKLRDYGLSELTRFIGFFRFAGRAVVNVRCPRINYVYAGIFQQASYCKRKVEGICFFLPSVISSAGIGSAMPGI